LIDRLRGGIGTSFVGKLAYILAARSRCSARASTQGDTFLPTKTQSAARTRKSATSKTTAKPAAKAASKTSSKPAKKSVAKTVDKIAKKPAAAKPKKPQIPADPVERLRLRVLTALDDLKAQNVQEIDVRGKTSIADLLIVASGTSTRHVKSLADEVVKFAKQTGMPPLGVEGQREAEWVLVDLGDIVVHVMLPRVREFYGLERLWTVGDQAPQRAAAG
jgi:ribosome silencing factor RsfS/YbeB/iojap